MSAISETDIYPSENSELTLLNQTVIFSIKFDSIILKLFKIDTSMYSMYPPIKVNKNFFEIKLFFICIITTNITYKKNKRVIANKDLAKVINVKSGTPLLTVGPFSAEKVCSNQALTKSWDLFKINSAKIESVGSAKPINAFLDLHVQYL